MCCESKNLRINDSFTQIFSAKLLRLALLAQDDKMRGLPDKFQFNDIYEYISIERKKRKAYAFLCIPLFRRG